MNTTPQDNRATFPPMLEERLQQLRGQWWVFLTLGVGLILLGGWAIGAPIAVTLATVTLSGILLLISGVLEVAGAFWSGRWKGFFLQLFVGVLHLVVGFILVTRPGLTAAAFTLMLTAFLITGGLLRIVTALSDRFFLWGWVVLNGIVSLLLGIMIWQEWPEASLWVIGTFVGIDVLFAGVHWLMIGLALRRIPERTGEAPPPHTA